MQRDGRTATDLSMLHSQNTPSAEPGLHPRAPALPVQPLTRAIYDGSLQDGAALPREIGLHLFLIRHKLGNNFQALPPSWTRGSHLEQKGPLKPIASVLKYPISNWPGHGRHRGANVREVLPALPRWMVAELSPSSAAQGQEPQPGWC